MRSTNSHARRWLLAVVTVALAVAAATYTLRDHLTSVPFIGTLWPVTDGSTMATPAAGATTPSMDMAGMDMPAEEPLADPRAEINLDLRRRQLVPCRSGFDRLQRR